MTKRYIKIVVDYGGLDYVTNINRILVDELDTIKPLLRAISKFKPYSHKDNEFLKHEHNFPIGESVNDKQGELDAFDYYYRKARIKKETIDFFISTFLPDTPIGIHTIVSIEIFEVSNVVKLV